MTERPRSGDEPEVLLDLSRLVSRILHPTPTGVDRVEMAYARELHRRVPERLAFCAVHPSGFYGRIPEAVALRFLDETERAWEDGHARPAHGLRRLLRAAGPLARMRPRPVPGPDRARRRVLVQSSPHHLHRADLIRTVLRREAARWICLLHDLIPIEYPEYARPGGDALHRRRVASVALLADAVVANSAATAHSFASHALPNRAVPVRVAHLGLHEAAVPPPRPAGERPYFVCLGTIEPRKNHLLLLHLWRTLSEQFGAAEVPSLLVVGRRGWENEQVVDLLERCPALVGCVEELPGLSDSEVRAAVAGARALLLPSFAEGYGMPVPEALALGVPVICSDLPALREAGGDAPAYLDPLDGPGWRREILALAEDGPVRDAHLRRVAAWIPPTWSAHLDVVLDLVEALA